MIRYGVSPIAWSNDDMPSLGGATTLNECLADIRDVGFEGVELGGKFPREAGRLREMLSQYELALIGGWYSTNLLRQSEKAEIENLQSHLALLRALGCDVFIAAETSNAIHGDVGAPLINRPEIDAIDWRNFCRKMSAVANYVTDAGLKFAYHHHLGTIVERREDLQRFFDVTSENVGITLDTGHAAGGEIDPVQVIADYSNRIAHFHCKDIRRQIFNEVRLRGGSFLSGVVDGMFTAPGDGDLDFAPIFSALSAIDYSGWIVVEAEQDPEKANPKQYAKIGLSAVRETARNTGLVVEHARVN